MTEQALPGFSRVCPECGRRVPNKVRACRCGCAREEMGDTAEVAAVKAVALDDQTAQRRGSSRVIAGFVVAAAAGLAVFFWTIQTPPVLPGAGVVAVARNAPATPRAIAPTGDAVADEPAPPSEVLPSVEPPPPAVSASAAALPPATALPAAGPSSLEDVISRAMPAVVRVETPGGFGSGFFVAPDTILTNVHVVGSNSSVTIRRIDGRTTSARVDTTAPEFDIAIMRISNPDPNQPTLTMGSGMSARAGQEIIALGTPLGLQNTVTRGIVSAVRDVGGVTLVQTDAAINPGNSGGPLLDRTGSVIGVATMSMRSEIAQGLSFGVAIEHAQSLLAGRRSAATGTPVSGLNQAMSGKQRPTESDTVREEGRRTYEQAIAVLARRADALDGHWRSFKSSCYEGRVAGSFDHEWFALWDQRAMLGAVSPGCGPSFADIRRIAHDIRNGVLGAEESARQTGVYPGMLREIRRRYRLDYPGWDR
jgi:S1-C subfamily serine protease